MCALYVIIIIEQYIITFCL